MVDNKFNDMKKQKRGNPDYKRLNDLNKFEAMNAERAEKRREKEIQIVNIVGGIIGIGTLIIAGLIYGWALTTILFFVILANKLCNVK